MHVRIVAAIIVWLVVALLLVNRIFAADWVTPLAIVLTLVAVLVYFSPRFLKKQQQATPESQPVVEHQKL